MKKDSTPQQQENWLQMFINEWKEEGAQAGMQKGLQIGHVAGHVEGRLKGRREEVLNIVTKMLNKRFGEISTERINKIEELTVAEIEQLSIDLLDFEQIADFDEWLLKNSN